MWFLNRFYRYSDFHLWCVVDDIIQSNHVITPLGHLATSPSFQFPGDKSFSWDNVIFWCYTSAPLWPLRQLSQVWLPGDNRSVETKLIWGGGCASIVYKHGMRSANEEKIIGGQEPPPHLPLPVSTGLDNLFMGYCGFLIWWCINDVIPCAHASAPPWPLKQPSPSLVALG